MAAPRGRGSRCGIRGRASAGSNVPNHVTSRVIRRGMHEKRHALSHPSPRATPVRDSNSAAHRRAYRYTCHADAQRAPGIPYTWGANGNGQLANGTTSNSVVPVQVASSPVIMAVAGGWHSLALAANGHVWAAGFNGYGQLNNATMSSSNTPVQVASLSSAIAIAGGGVSLSCADRWRRGGCLRRKHRRSAR